MNQAPLAAIELGGTKCVAAIGTAAGQVLAEIRFPTTTPRETLATATAWWREQAGATGPAAIGIGSFGPIQVNPNHPDFGTMLATPKPGWSGFPVLRSLQDAFPAARFALDTDVNAAALAECALGAARGHRDIAYITIGTGIGAGIIIDGKPVHGSLHPEFGHLKVPRHPDDTFAGVCPFHGDCLEGLAAGPAIHRRWECPAESLPEDHPAWEMQAWYLAHGILCLAAVTAPTLVLVGGGVGQAAGLHAGIACTLKDLSNGYFHAAEHPGYVIPPALGQQAGIAGSLLLAANA